MSLVALRAFPSRVALAIALSASLGCQSTDRSPDTRHARTEPVVHYVEVVTPDADALIGFYQSVHSLSFGAADPDLGGARVATQPDSSLLGIRKPLAEHESSIIRTYRAVDDITLAVKNAQKAGATVAYPPTPQGNAGTFAIVTLGGVEMGLWQRTK